MARSEARILVEIWDDPDFLALSVEDQRNYMFLFSQRDTAHTGVLPLRERRWSNAAADSTPTSICESLQRLADASFIVVDESTEEVLVRSLIRRDKIFRQPNVLRAAKDQLSQISSRRIRAALLVELDRIAEEEQVSGVAATVLDGMREDLRKGIGNPSGNPPDMPTPDPSGEPSDMPTRGTPGVRGVVTRVSSDSPNPNPLTPESPESAPPTPPRPPNGGRHLQAVAATPSTEPRRKWPDPAIDADPLFAAFWEAYPYKVSKGHARKSWLGALRKGADPLRIAQAARAFRDDRRRDPKFTPHPATWLNGERWNDVPAEPAAAGSARPFWEN